MKPKDDKKDHEWLSLYGQDVKGSFICSSPSTGRCAKCGAFTNECGHGRTPDYLWRDQREKNSE